MIATPPDRPWIAVQLDRPRRILLDSEAMIAFRNTTGDEMMSVFTKGTTLERFAVFLWAVLRADDPSLTRKQAAALVTPHNLLRIQAALAAHVGSAETGAN